MRAYGPVVQASGQAMTPLPTGLPPPPSMGSGVTTGVLAAAAGTVLLIGVFAWYLASTTPHPEPERVAVRRRKR